MFEPDTENHAGGIIRRAALLTIARLHPGDEIHN